MREIIKKSLLRKEIGLWGVFAIAAGTTLSSGFFLLPGLAAEYSGASIILAYALAALVLIPGMTSKIELATAMPRAGGVYFFLDRTLGPLVGTIGGIGTWLALVLKVTFALIGMGAYISLYIPQLSITPIAIGLAIILGTLNLFGVKKSENLQIILVAFLLFILSIFIVGGFTELNYHSFQGVFKLNDNSLIATTGMVFISYVGITKVISLSEEVKNPEKNIPKGIFFALTLAILIYILGVSVMVGTIPMDELKGDLTPVATAANNIFGKFGKILLSFAALFAFVSVANAGILSASRYPFAMSRDFILPSLFQKMGRTGIPFISVIVTVGIIILMLIFLDPIKIAKLASAFQLLLFALVSLSVIVMRESKIESYDPGYKSPFYPWLHIAGLILPFILIFSMGTLSILFSSGLVIIGVVWYFYYAKGKVKRSGAIYHVFERWGRARYDGIDTELRGILKEKGLREKDPFDDIVHRSMVIEITKKTEFENVVKKVSKIFSYSTKLTESEIEQRIMEGTRIGATPVTHLVALPHFKCENIDHAEMVLVRSKPGVRIRVFDPLSHEAEETKTVHGIFFLVSPESDPTQHLRILAKIAGRVDDEDFFSRWMNAKDDNELKEALIYDEQFYTLLINKHGKTKDIIGLEIRSMSIPEGCLITTVRRKGEAIIPKGNTVLKEHDRLIIMGDPKGIEELRNKYR